MKESEVKYDCKFFKGPIPCAPNKLDGSICVSCEHYEPIEKRLLIIKLGAIGDVIRTTPLIENYRKKYPRLSITWLSQFPDVLPRESIDEILKLDAINWLNLSKRSYDIAINLDKEEEACRLLSEVNAQEKYGYSWNQGHIAPATPAAEHKLLTGYFDSLSIENSKSYLEEIFDICHETFDFQEYQIRINEELRLKWNASLRALANGKKIIGLNTGCGPRWKTRLWSNDSWIELIRELQKQGYFCMVLGGPAEDEKNRQLSLETGAHYPGHFSLEEFISLTHSCDLIVTQVSLMMHIGIALKKQMILMNNIFNAHEFELYGRGEIIQPRTGCDCYYGSTCSREKHCMEDLRVEDILQAITKAI